jgi:hypothetical protein
MIRRVTETLERVGFSLMIFAKRSRAIVNINIEEACLAVECNVVI